MTNFFLDLVYSFFNRYDLHYGPRSLLNGRWFNMSVYTVIFALIQPVLLISLGINLICS